MNTGRVRGVLRLDRAAFEGICDLAFREYPLEIELHFTSWVFQPGHRMRVAVTNSQWPMFWPTPYPMTTSLRLGGGDATRIVLPVNGLVSFARSANLQDRRSTVAFGNLG